MKRTIGRHRRRQYLHADSPRPSEAGQSKRAEDQVPAGTGSSGAIVWTGVALCGAWLVEVDENTDEKDFKKKCLRFAATTSVGKRTFGVQMSREAKTK